MSAPIHCLATGVEVPGVCEPPHGGDEPRGSAHVVDTLAGVAAAE